SEFVDGPDTVASLYHREQGATGFASRTLRGTPRPWACRRALAPSAPRSIGVARFGIKARFARGTTKFERLRPRFDAFRDLIRRGRAAPPRARRAPAGATRPATRTGRPWRASP